MHASSMIPKGYADDSVLMVPTMEQLCRRVAERKVREGTEG